MEELKLIIQDFEETCSMLTNTQNSPDDSQIKEVFEKYHQTKLNLLTITDVSQQRELLIDFLDELKPSDYMELKFKDIVDNYLKAK